LQEEQKKGAQIEIKARINPISYEKPMYKRHRHSYYCEKNVNVDRKRRNRAISEGKRQG
jgi:hypothetical protein